MSFFMKFAIMLVFMLVILILVMQFAGSGAKACTVRHILVKTEDECKVAKERIDNGEDFSKVAKELSTCPSGKSGGSLGTFAPGKMVREFDAACFNRPETLKLTSAPSFQYIYICNVV